MDQQVDTPVELFFGCYPAAADVAGASRVRPSNHRSGNHCINCSAGGFSPNPNNPGRASRRYTKGLFFSLLPGRLRHRIV